MNIHRNFTFFLCSSSTFRYFQFKCFHFHINIFYPDPQKKKKEEKGEKKPDPQTKFRIKLPFLDRFLSYIVKIRYIGSKCYMENKYFGITSYFHDRLDSIF